MGIAGIAALIANACGSDSSGTEKSGCDPQATRECVGPAACKGGQVCGPDGNWLACDCGGSGGSSGTGGTGGSGGSSAGGGTGGTSATGGTGGTGAGTTGGTGGASDAGDASIADSASDVIDTGVGPNDDPCPTDPINVNCSTSCGPMTEACTGICTWANPPITDQTAATHYVIRTPANPGVPASLVGCYCGSDAGPQALYVMQVYLKGIKGTFRIKVGKPWKVMGLESWLGPQFCLNYPYLNGCTSAGTFNVPTDFSFFIATDDPNAPARNAVIEQFSGPACGTGDFWQ